MPKQVIVMPFSRQLIGQRHNSQTGEKVGTALEVDSIFKEMRGVSASANSANEALSGMATCRKTVTAKITGALTAIVFAGGLAAGFAGPAAAAECPAGAPVPYGLIGDTWRTVDRYQAGGVVKDRIGCPIEPEHGVPGRNGRLQTFQNGQIAWTPDQGPHMTIWAIRDKAHFRVQWSTNDNWSYDSYLIRWDRDGQNIGQRDISGNFNGWWDFDFDTPGTYTFIVEGHSGGGYHHGWTIPVGGTIQRRDIPPPNVPARMPLPPPPSQLARPLKVGERGQLLSLQGLGFYPTRLLRCAL
jgi:hypothetical protein